MVEPLRSLRCLLPKTIRVSLTRMHKLTPMVSRNDFCQCGKKRKKAGNTGRGILRIRRKPNIAAIGIKPRPCPKPPESFPPQKCWPLSHSRPEAVSVVGVVHSACPPRLPPPTTPSSGCKCEKSEKHEKRRFFLGGVYCESGGNPMTGPPHPRGPIPPLVGSLPEMVERQTFLKPASPPPSVGSGGRGEGNPPFSCVAVAAAVPGGGRPIGQPRVHHVRLPAAQ